VQACVDRANADAVRRSTYLCGRNGCAACCMPQDRRIHQHVRDSLSADKDCRI